MRYLDSKSGKGRLAVLLIIILILQGTWPVPGMTARADGGMDGEQYPAHAQATPDKTDSSFDEEEILKNDLATPGDGKDTLDDDPATPDDAEELQEYNLASPVNLLRSAGVGDLWADWNGDPEFSGSGTQSHPYQIDSLAQLMGLSEQVASGKDFAGEYFELTRDLDLSGIQANGGSWNPIGWYQNASELAGEVTHPFGGHFDGGGNTISGLRIINPAWKLKNIGLFGAVCGGSIRNLTVEAEDIHGAENAAVLAGNVSGNTVIAHVVVSGYVHSAEDAGGIAAEVCGTGKPDIGDHQVTIENCRADGIILNSTGTESFVGGIAGNVQRAYLADNTVITQNGDSNRIQGKGYVGGIAGRMRETNIYNSYVNGTVGGNGTRAAGGIVGKYESGHLILARMAGDISRTNNGSASREGTFVGTRDSRDNFTYGTEKDSRLSYLYTTSAVKAKRVFGSNIDGDNSFTKSAHIGYWTDLERKYVTVAGKTENGCGDRYFYEELEDGIRYIITQKLNREFTVDGYAKNLAFRIDHFAPGHMGEPVRGYLVSVPRIDARNANGTFDTDVASLTAISETGSSYYRAIDKDSAAAIAPGAVVTVSTAPKNTNENRYQMVTDTSENGGVKPPVYRDEDGNAVPMNYVNGGAYSFIMPACDTELNVEYIKVTTVLTVDPAETVIHVIHTRNGDRKHPGIVTEVKNADGILIARYIDGEQDRTVEVQPVTIHAEHNGAGQTVDRTVRWSVDDLNLLLNRSENGYTQKDAAILPNLESSFIQDIIAREVEAQASNQYREKISNTVYTKYAVVTGTTNPDTSVNNQPVYGNCRVAVAFQMTDNTTLRVEGIKLNEPELTFTVTRRLTGSRYNPVETITCTEPVVLTASLVPQKPFLKNVSWSDEQSGKVIALEPSGSYMQDCRISVNFDPNGQAGPAWIQNIINADRAKKKSNPMLKVDGNGLCRETVTVTSEDQTHGHVTAECRVTVQFVTLDETTAGSSGSGGGSGGGGGGGGGFSSGSKGVTAEGATMASGPSLPAYVVTGTWAQNAAGRWIFMDSSRTFANEWAAVHNPYANSATGQNVYDWFRFDAEGFLMTGWYTDENGDTYFLNAVSDGTLGRLLTGWNWIEGKCYYFNADSDGTKGALKRNYTASDGRQTDRDGALKD